MTDPISGSNLIDCKRVPGDGESFNAVNPATGAILTPSFSAASQTQVDTAVSAALRAFESTQDLPPHWQATFLDTIADRVMDLGDALLERAEAESALPRPRLTGERGRTTGQLKLFASLVREGSWVDAVIDTADPARKPAPKPDVRRMLIPRGPVAVFGASNFPLAFGALGGDTASALAAGNPVIVKGHPSHPGTSELMASAVLSAIDQLKLPTGLFSLLQGTSHALSGSLVKHPGVEAVGFTGSQRGGRALFDLAAARPRPIPVYAEMGSLNPLVILPGAIKERSDQIAQGLAASILLGAGQFCTKPGLILLVGDAPDFVQSLARQIQSSPAFTLLNQGLRNAFSDRTAHFSKLTGVTTHVTGQPAGHANTTGMLFQTTADHFTANPALHEEAFGPAALIVTCRDADQALAVARTVGGSLTGTLHTGSSDSPADIRKLLRGLESIAGRVILNGYPTGVEVCHAMVHGGPYPATTDPNSTSVGTGAIRRFARMVSFQDLPDPLLPPDLQNANPLSLWRTVNGERTKQPIASN